MNSMFSKKQKVVSIDITEDELNKRVKIDLKVNLDLRVFIPLFLKELMKNKEIKNF